MITRQYRCTLLSNAILQEKSATEAISSALNYIPGSQFLGIASHGYKNYKDPFEIFHSGKVRFSNAYPEIDRERSLPIPLTWMRAKEESPIQGNRKTVFYLDPRLVKNSLLNDSPISDNKQYKSIREGFINTKNFQLTMNEETYSLKSARNRETRKSTDGQLFGFVSVQAGARFLFLVEAPDDANINSIETYLLGEHFLGRSKSAEFGLARIERIAQTENPILTKTPELKDIKGTRFITIYAESDIVLIDKYGRPTAKPCVEDFDLDPDKVTLCQDRCAVRTRSYSPWNGKRKSRDIERSCIRKGSVFLFKIDSQFNIEEYVLRTKEGIGAYRPEGLGRVLINPSFLVEIDENGSPKQPQKANNLPLNSIQPEAFTENNFIPSSENDPLIEFLHNRKELTKISINISTRVKEFKDKNKKKYNGISPSQWGTIRSIASQALDKKMLDQNLFAKEDGFLEHGISAPKWAIEDRKSTLKQVINEINNDPLLKSGWREFILLLCSEMQKE